MSLGPFGRKSKRVFGIVCFVAILYILGNNLCKFKRRELRKSQIQNVHKNLEFHIPIAANGMVESRWQYIGNSSYRHQIYSAYFDTRIELLYDVHFDGIKDTPYGSVRIFAALSLHMRYRVQCSFKYESGLEEQVSAAEAQPVEEHFDMEFSIYTIMCPVSRKDGNAAILPSYVALMYQDNPITYFVPTYVPISYPAVGLFAPRKKALHVCVGPMHNNCNETLRLVEFIEMYLLLGAELLNFHLLSASHEVIAVLNYYEAQNKVRTRYWNFHGYEFERDIRYGGIMAEFNDCVYRTTFVEQIEYVAVVDLDEILMPMRSTSLVDLTLSIDDNRTSEYIFRNVFFAQNHKNDTLSRPDGVRNPFLYTQVKVERSQKPYPARARSKYIAKGIAAIEMGNHNLWRWIDGYAPRELDPSEAMLFHYRTKCIQCDEVVTADLTARRFGSVLWSNVDRVCRDIFSDGICPL